MRQRGRSGAFVAGVVATLALASGPAAIGHVRKSAGPYSVELGWADEPVYGGLRNAVEVRVEDSAGAPVADPRASLRVEVSFGTARRELVLAPAAERGAYAAAIVPTRPGVYAFHVTGMMRGRRVDVAATCSPSTFECVEGPGTIQFPVAEPAAGDLDRKLDRALARAARGEDAADEARTLAISALVAAALALVAAAAVALRAARRE
jgi:hypothetical protein